MFVVNIKFTETVSSKLMKVSFPFEFCPLIIWLILFPEPPSFLKRTVVRVN